jgi:peroxiredoxin
MKWMLLLCLVACGGHPHGPTLPKDPIALTLPALDGGEIDLAAHRGQVVVLHVFTTWSLAATGDVPQLQAAADRGKDVVVIGIALDPEGRALVAPWRAALSVSYLVALADPAFVDGQSDLGRFAAVPATVVLDRTGRVARRIDRQLAAGELAGVIDEVSRAR